MIGRIEEIKALNALYDSKESQLIAIYGRRRVGKTYLIDDVFRNRFTFRHAGLSPAETEKKGAMQRQLTHFYRSLLMHGMPGQHIPADWFEAFFMLEQWLRQIDDGSRQLVFLDEMPWLDTPRSNFISAFEGFWNAWACHRKNLMVIICGSATSWIQDKLIHNHGGLYNRLTYHMHLAPFTLQESESYLIGIGASFSRYDIVQSQMVLGGIPYYLGYMKPSLSFAQNVDRIFFGKNPILRDEYHQLFSSIFANPEHMEAIIELLYQRNAGFTQKEIATRLGINDGGRLSNNLKALVASDFVEQYIPFQATPKVTHYRLTDPFCLFYLHFVHGRDTSADDYWQSLSQTQAVISWRGFAFENVCFHHIQQIKEALRIGAVSTKQSAWSKKDDDETGTQIDLLLDRRDNVLSMCEIKFYGDMFTVSKDYYMTLLHRQNVLLQSVSKKTSIHSVLITTFGLVRNKYSDAFQNVITLDDLFQ